ncbi:MAG: Cof-type HAD-IIB family hydrolase [Sphaerochaetaceae bacterium]|nr:Cof-type HAD-IIB family hydrolase [Sphaerochaetaceae bacterium]NLO61207.1 HAD family phosphatase [Spirochaetales bacterium]MDD2406268.1 Cof-type HAD-IIB family hydrolase [Sphaerochaetaceae bacterium]MDD3670888.1 Cof-type HAD-IIB family hydrolase [Sphaerochaetaceae bacterium]MDD4260233.1 Cof-type HAD-IIB family hydrolase [Sphaerochaetaceae bacterium]
MDKMHIKAVAFDLDGTLLTSDKHVAPSSIKAISRLRDMGILPVVATGRNVALARHLIIQAGIPTPLINCNGACIYDWDHDTDLLHITLNEKASLAALEFARQSSCHLHVFMDHEIYFEEDGKYADFLEPISTEIGKVVDFSTFFNHPRFTKAMYIGRMEETLPVRRLFEQHFGDTLSLVYSHPEFFEVMPKEATKGAALATLMETYGISSQETMAFGDSENDIEMLQWVGHPVAMANASDQVKALFDNQAPSNDDDGIARYLESFFGWT